MRKHLTEFLEDWAESVPERPAITFLDVAGRERESYTYQALIERTRDLASYLVNGAGLKPGDRVMLVYPPGLEVIAAFYACARAGLIAVPVYPPTPMSFESGMMKLAYIARDCGARAALTTRGFYSSYRLLIAKRKVSELYSPAPELPELEWLTTDDARGFGTDKVIHTPSDVLFLQYTSGSTSDPKGVIVSHRNVIANCMSTVNYHPIGASWLPQYHDMGFIGYYLYIMIKGGSTYGFSPLDFLKRPALWFEVITRFQATTAAAPNFAYDYCLREDKLPNEALQGIDLSSLIIMKNAAEPVRAETFRRFRERFERYGLKRDAYMVAYGLAENTLAVSLYGKRSVTVNKLLLQQRKLHIESIQPRNNNQTDIVSCGRVLPDIEVAIVDPDSLRRLPEKQIGEIWIAGEAKCQGYWNRPEKTRETFQATIAGEDSSKQYLRSGDLGFMLEDELYVCGRVKDLIIIRGVNYYPQDIETIVENSCPQVRRGCVAAFSVDTSDGEALIVVAELDDERQLPALAPIARAIRTQYYVEPHTIAFVRKRSIPKTTSGKLARSQARERWIRGEMEVIGSHASATTSAAEMTGLRDRFRYIVELYNLTGHEEFTFAAIGIDSLTMVQLIDDIKQLMIEHGAGELVDAVDIRLLQKLTIAQFFSLLDEFEKQPDQPIEALAELLRLLHAEYDAHEAECMRTDAQLELNVPATHKSNTAVTDVLLTGATGFFGPFLLSGLLRKTNHTYHVLTRATDPIHGRDRLRAAMRRARVWTPELDAALDSRVHIVCGDLVRDRLGVPLRDWEELSQRVQAICHNGALVNYVLSYEELRPHNVEGTRELLRLAIHGRKKAFHLISSTFIFGWSVKKVLWESDGNPEMANLDFGYAQSKWVAERLVFEAQKQGLDVRVYRPSLISASTGGVGSRDDIAIRLLAFMIRYGIAVDALNQISFLPADLVADNIASIFDLPFDDNDTLHITSDSYYNMADVTRTISRLYGYQFEYFEIPTFVKKMNEHCTKSDLLYPLLDFFNRSYERIEAMRDKRYSNELYRAARSAGQGESDPPLDAVVTFIVEYMKREGLIDDEARSQTGSLAALPR